MKSAAAKFDAIIIGGGINGAGIARDAALRGLNVLLLEAADFGGGTSSWSSRLIHGGLRYLEYGEIPLVYESLHERRYLRRIASHLVSPLKLIIPLYRGGTRPPWLVRLGMIAYDTLSMGKSLPRHRMLSKTELLELVPSVSPEGLRAGASYYDAQITYAERLVIENIVAAAEAGADVRNYHAVSGIDFATDGEHAVTFTAPNGVTQRAYARSIVNAAGPWVDRVLDGTQASSARLMGGTKGSHIITSAFAGAPSDAFYVEAASDGRPVFIIPWNGQYLIGTTDIRFDGDPRDAVASVAEVDYLLATANAVFPRAQLTREDINYSYAGVRPLPYVKEGPESAITRRHIIHSHDGVARGLLSIIGGKLTTYRNLAEQVVDSIERSLKGATTRCVTASTALPGGGDTSAANDALANIAGLPESLRHRLLGLYGSRVARLAQLCAESPELSAGMDSGYIGAEVAMAVRDEFACNLVDLMHRRLMLGLAADQGRAVAAGVAAIAAAELGWDASQTRQQLAELADYNRRLQPGTGNNN
ncbi:MAG: glycerol-3-phosphate dehydrogenase [Woeseia sp.]